MAWIVKTTPSEKLLELLDVSRDDMYNAASRAEITIESLLSQIDDDAGLAEHGR